jgi:hypothetical protein
LAAQRQFWVNVRGEDESVELIWSKPRFIPHRTGRTCKMMYPRRATNSCGVPCLRNCQRIACFRLGCASLRCCMAAHLLCVFTTPVMFLARLCMSQVRLASIKVESSVLCSSQPFSLGYTKRKQRLRRPNPFFESIIMMITAQDPPSPS